jgi:uncharacterized protein YuzE
MSVKIAGIEFEHHHYDERGDVLYVNASGYDGKPARAYETPEGHNVEYDETGRLVSIVFVNVKWLLEREGELKITWPAGHLTPDELAPALVSAA